MNINQIKKTLDHRLVKGYLVESNFQGVESISCVSIIQSRISNFGWDTQFGLQVEFQNHDGDIKVPLDVYLKWLEGQEEVANVEEMAEEELNEKSEKLWIKLEEELSKLSMDNIILRCRVRAKWLKDILRN